jgi:hypothetical protein
MSEFSRFISERERVRLRREAGEPAPWTKDPILQRFRFCNVNREHDRVTIGIRRIYRDVDPHWLWFNLVIARLFNNVAFLEHVGPLTSKKWRWPLLDAANDFKAQGNTVFNAAYIVSTNGRKMDKVQYVVNEVLTPLSMYADRPAGVAPLSHRRCAEWAEWMLRFQGLGDFMANQVITDYKYTVLLPRRTTPDWTTFVMAGPGTQRGLNRLMGRPVHGSIRRDVGVQELKAVRDLLVAQRHELVPHFADLNNLSNCFCEFDKYMRAKTGEGRPKQLFKPAETTP